MRAIKIALMSLVVLIGLSVASYAYDIVQVTNTPEVDEESYSIALLGNAVYATWVVNLPPGLGGRLYFDKSMDLGKTWGNYRKVIATTNSDAIISPKVIISQNGKIFVLYKTCAYDYKGWRCGDGYIYLIVSEDDGENFFNTGFQRHYLRCWNPDFTINETGDIIYVVSGDEYPHSDYTTPVYLWKSFDGGRTFSNKREIFSVWFGLGFDIELSKDSKDLYLFIKSFKSDYWYVEPWRREEQLGFTKSLDYGDIFDELKEVFHPPYSYYRVSDIDSAIDKNGKIYVACNYQPGDCSIVDWSGVALVESSDKGENFSSLFINDTPEKGSRPSIDIDNTANIYCVFIKDAYQNNSYVGREIYFDRRIGVNGFGIDKYLVGPVYTSRPLIKVTPDGTTAVIMWGSGDLYCTTFPTNEPPILAPIGNKEVNERELLDFTVSATDPDGDTLTYLLINKPEGAQFNIQTGRFIWTPDYNQTGTYEGIKFMVSDGTLTAEETITITVHNTNRSPVITPIGNKSVNEGKLLQFTVSATDPDNDPITYSAINLPQGATINSKTGQFKWTPNYKQAGRYIVTFVASDGNLSAGETITITVNNVPMPDLVSGVISHTPSQPRQGNYVIFRVPITNIGDKKAGRFTVSLNVAGEIKNQTVYFLFPRGTINTIFIWRAKRGTYTVTTIADATKVIQEQDENNNTSTKVITVR